MTTHYRKKTNSFYLEFLGLRYEMTVMSLEWVLGHDTSRPNNILMPQQSKRWHPRINHEDLPKEVVLAAMQLLDIGRQIGEVIVYCELCHPILGKVKKGSSSFREA